MLLLDTHVLVWSLEGDTRRIGRRTRAMLARAEAEDAVRVSPLTLFEISALHTLGRIRLTQGLDEWLREVLDSGRLRIAELTPAAAIGAGMITRIALPDPLDRLLVATARALGATFLTCDERILQYASTDWTVRVHDASR